MENEIPVTPAPSGEYEKEKYTISIPLYLVLTIFTCGLFNLYWNYRQMEACNDLVGRKEFNFILWFFLSIITCGLYFIYYQYKMGSIIVEIQRMRNKPTFDNLPILGTILTIFGLSIITDCIHQSEINKIVA